jgi:hypothetical protein
MDTRERAVLVNGHSGSPEKLKFRLSGKPAQKKSRAHFSMGEVWQLGMELSSRKLVRGCGGGGNQAKNEGELDGPIDLGMG